MGRWRPPSPESSPYITPAGFDVLQKELDDIWVRRRDVVKALAAAAAEGDRSENAEYIYRKKELGGLDRRIRYLQKRLPVLKVVRASPAGIGAAVLDLGAGARATCSVLRSCVATPRYSCLRGARHRRASIYRASVRRPASPVRCHSSP